MTESIRKGSTQRERDAAMKQKYEELQKNRKIKGLARTNSSQAPSTTTSLRAPSRGSEATQKQQHQVSSQHNNSMSVASGKKCFAVQSELAKQPSNTSLKQKEPHMNGLGRTNSKVASRDNLHSCNGGNLAHKHQELVNQSFSYQTQGYLDQTGLEYQPKSGQANRKKSPALRRLESSRSRSRKGSHLPAAVPLRPNHHLQTHGSLPEQQPSANTSMQFGGGTGPGVSTQSNPTLFNGQAEIRMIQRNRHTSRSRSANNGTNQSKSRSAHSRHSRGRSTGQQYNRRRHHGSQSTTPRKGGSRKISANSIGNSKSGQKQQPDRKTPKIYTHNKIVNNSKSKSHRSSREGTLSAHQYDSQRNHHHTGSHKKVIAIS